MNLKIIIQLLIILAVIATLGICITKPTMHKSVLVYDSGYTLNPDTAVTTEEIVVPVVIEQPQVETVKMTVNEKIDSQIAQEQAQTIQYQMSKQPNTVTYTQNQTQKVISQPVTQQQVSTVRQQTQTPVQKTVTTPVTQTTYTNTATPVTSTQVQNNNISKTAALPQTTQTVVNKSAPIGVTQQTTKSAPIGNTTTVAQNRPVTTQKTTQAAPQPKVLTAQEEQIAWAKWDSNLVNKIISTAHSRMPVAPNGTQFRFRFTVDRYGKISNIETYSTNPTYTPYAIQHIKPVIQSLQGHSILTFPYGSNRVVHDLSGAWQVTNSGSNKNSTYRHFDDVEKVTR